MTKCIISFADSRLSSTSERFTREAVSLRTFDYVRVYSEFDFSSELQSQFGEYLQPGVRGFGYWVWKPWIIKNELESLRDGDLLVYSDVGFTLRPEGRHRLGEYLDKATNSDLGILLFQAVRPGAESPVKDDGRSIPAWFDRYWTKADLLDYFDVRKSVEIIDTPQIQSGLIFIRKCKESVEFIDKWLEVFKFNMNLVDDSESMIKNYHGFREHRHDQSVLSLLGKIHRAETVSSSEFWIPKWWSSLADWKLLEETPFHARRDLDFGSFAGKSGANKDANSKIAFRSLTYNLILFCKRIFNLARPVSQRFL